MSGTPGRLRPNLSLPGLVLGLVGPALALGLAPTPTAQALAGASAEVRVNTTVFNNQSGSDVAADADGDYVVTWSSSGQDGSGLGVYAQRYNAAGIPQGGEWQVNTATASDQYEPSVAMDADGDFVITWTSSAQDGADHGVYAQRYNAAGATLGVETRVNTVTTSSQFMPSVAMDADGDYVIAWTSYLQDGAEYGIYAQRYNAAGATQGVETKVNFYTTSFQERPAVAMSADGDYVIAWASLGQDTSGYGIYSQRYNAAGVVQGVETRVNTATANSQYQPSAAMAADGDYVITWTSHLQDGSEGGVYAQRYNAGGTAQGGETPVNTTTTNYQLQSQVAMDADGDYVVAWASDGQDGSGYGTYTQRYDADGTAQGGETRVNATTAGAQNQPSIAMDADGDRVLTWTSAGQDGSGEGIYARRFRGPEAVDLRLTQTDDTDPVAVEEPLVYRIRVTNDHDLTDHSGVPAVDSAIGAATGVRVLIATPDGASLVSATGTDWACGPATATMTCRYTRTLLPETIAPTLVLTYDAPTAAGTVQASARVAQTHLDPDPANNIEVERTAVLCSVEFTNPSYTIVEAGNLSVGVTRHGTGCGTTTVQYETASGSAAEGPDFAGVADTLTWGPGDAIRTFDVPIVADALDEKTESFKLRLSNPTGMLAGNRSLVNGFITDNDLPPRINFVTTSGTAAEPGALVEVSVRLSEASGQPVTVTLAPSGTATLGSDYFAPAKVTVPAGVRTVQFALEVADDGVIEGAETAILTLTTPVAVTIGSLKTYTLTITSNE